MSNSNALMLLSQFLKNTKQNQNINKNASTIEETIIKIRNTNHTNKKLKQTK